MKNVLFAFLIVGILFACSEEEPQTIEQPEVTNVLVSDLVTIASNFDAHLTITEDPDGLKLSYTVNVNQIDQFQRSLNQYFQAEYKTDFIMPKALVSSARCLDEACDCSENRTGECIIVTCVGMEDDDITVDQVIVC